MGTQLSGHADRVFQDRVTQEATVSLYKEQ